MPTSTNSNSADSSWRWYLAVLVLCGILRAAVLVELSSSLEDDPDSYRHYAQSLLEHGDFIRNGCPSAWRPPLYPLLLGGCLSLPTSAEVSIAVLHWSLGLGTVGLAMSLAVRLGLGRASALVGLLVAADPILLRESASIMTETLATFLAVASLWTIDRLLTRKTLQPALIAGLVLGLSVLCRPTFLVWDALLLILVFWETRPRWSAFGAVVLASALTVAPWAIRNWQELGRPIITTTHGGYTLLLGNNPYFYDFLRTRESGETWDSQEFVADWQSALRAAHPDREIGEDQFAYSLARHNIYSFPGDFLQACIYRWTSFWRIAPLGGRSTQLGQIATLGIAAWYSAVYLLAAVGLFSLTRQSDSPDKAVQASELVQRTRWLPAILLVITLSAIHTLYWSDMRMRGPAMPALALLAGRATGLVLNRWNGATERGFRS